MAKIIHFEDDPKDNSRPDSLLSLTVKRSCALAGALIFIIFLPAFVISFIFCWAANTLVYETTGGYLMRFNARMGCPEHTAETD